MAPMATFNDEKEPQEDDELNSENYEMENKMNSHNSSNRSAKQIPLHSKYRKILSDPNQRFQACLLLIILILGIILLIIGVHVLIHSMAKPEEICETDRCLFAAARFSSKITDQSRIDPCDNFYEFTCGKWINDNPLSEYQGYHSIRDEVKNQIYLELKHYLDKISFKLPHTDPFFKVKKFYESCMDLENIDRDNSLIKYEINDAGGWNIIGNWHRPDWAHEKTVERLQTYYGVNTFFTVSIGADDLDPQLPFIIKIQPSGLGLPQNYYFDPQYKKVVEAYKQYMSETVKIFGATQLDSNQFAENTFSYEKRIAEIYPQQNEYFNRSTMYKRRYSIRELKNIAPSIQWSNVLQNYFQKARLNDNTRVLLAFEYYFRNISVIISTTDSKGLNDFLIWKMLNTYAPYLTKDFRIIHYNFQQAFRNLPSSISMSDEDRWKFCMETTSQFLGHALSSLYAKNKIDLITNKTTEIRSGIIGPLQKTILEHWDSFIWADDEEDVKLINMKMKQMEILVGQSQFSLKPRISDYYNDYFVGIKFLQNIFNAVNHKHRKMEMLLNEKSYDYSWPLFAQDVDIFYDYAGNKLFVPAGILNIPYYDRQAPAVAHFGAIGFHIASQMLKAFDLIGLYYNLPDGRLSNNKEFIENYHLNRGLRCLRNKIITISPQLNDTISQTYIDLGALEMAWLAFKQFESHHEEPRLPGIPFNNDQLFFISFAQTFCSNTKPKTLETLYTTSLKLPDSVRVNALLSQSETFSNVFQCKRPVDDLCQLWK